MSRRQVNYAMASESVEPDRELRAADHGSLAAPGSPAAESAEHKRLMRVALGDLNGRHGEKLCGKVLLPGETRPRYLYRMPDGLHVAGAPVGE